MSPLRGRHHVGSTLLGTGLTVNPPLPPASSPRQPPDSYISLPPLCFCPDSSRGSNPTERKWIKVKGTSAAAAVRFCQISPYSCGSTRGCGVFVRGFSPIKTNVRLFLRGRDLLTPDHLSLVRDHERVLVNKVCGLGLFTLSEGGNGTKRRVLIGCWSQISLTAKIGL